MLARLTVLGLALAGSMGAAAQQQAGKAVSHTNLNLSGGHAQARSTDSQDVRLEVNLPMGQLFGLNGEVERRWIEATEEEEAVDADERRGQLGLYAREFGRGLFGFEYEQTRLEREDDQEVEGTTYRGIFAMYDRAFDVTFRRAQTQYEYDDGEDDDTVHTASLELAGYAGANVRAATTYGFLADKDDLGVTIAYQPEFAGNNMAFEVGYEDRDEGGEVYSGRVVYYFGAKMTLRTRHRQALLP